MSDGWTRHPTPRIISKGGSSDLRDLVRLEMALKLWVFLAKQIGRNRQA